LREELQRDKTFNIYTLLSLYMRKYARSYRNSRIFASVALLSQFERLQMFPASAISRIAIASRENWCGVRDRAASLQLFHLPNHIVFTHQKMQGRVLLLTGQKQANLLLRNLREQIYIYIYIYI
jgi:hypothetical protein